MVALICEALTRCRRPGARARWRSGLNPLRAMRAVTLRAIRPAIVAAAVLARARAARRGDHDPDGLRREVVRAEADRRTRLLLRAAAHARLGDRRLPRRNRRAAAARGRSTPSRCCCSSRPSSCRSPATSSSCPCASTRRADERRRPQRAASRGRPERARPALFASQLALERPPRPALRMDRGPRAVLDRRRDRHLHGRPRHRVPAARADLQPAAGQPEPGRLGRLPRPAARDR